MTHLWDLLTWFSYGKFSVEIDCSPATGNPVIIPATISGGNFSAIFTPADLANLPCGCGSNIQVDVRCEDTGNTCTDKSSLTLSCNPDNCDCINFFEAIGNCNPNGTRTVTFFASHTNSGYNPSGCSIDFGHLGNQSPLFTFAPNTPLSFSYDYPAGTYTASLNRPGCPPEEITIVIPPCNPCQSLVTTHSVDNDCDAQGRRTVTLFASIGAGWPPTPGVWDFGDSSPTQNISLNPPGGTVVTTHDYFPGTYTATLTLQNCPPVPITIVVPDCPDCCPDIQNIDIQVLGCNSDCEREVRITTEFESPSSGCDPSIMEWQYFDNNSNLLGSSTTFTTNGQSPFLDTQFFPQSVSPVQAVLNIVSPNGCADEIRNITIPPCTDPPGCPQWGSPAIEHTVLDCVTRGNACCRKVEFRINGDFDIGCSNNNPPPRIRIEYGDGNYDERDIQFSGPQQVTFVNEYCQGGNYQVRVFMVNPTGCPEPPSYTISVPACNDEDCDNPPPPPPEPPKPFCPCCIWLLLLNLSYFILWAFGLYQGSITILNVELGVGGAASIIYGLLILLIYACYRRNPDCNPCWLCRMFKCMFYSLLIVAAIILILAVLPFVTVPQWFRAFGAALGAALIFFGLFRSQRCRRFLKREIAAKKRKMMNLKLILFPFIMSIFFQSAYTQHLKPECSGGTKSRSQVVSQNTVWPTQINPPSLPVRFGNHKTQVIQPYLRRNFQGNVSPADAIDNSIAVSSDDSLGNSYIVSVVNTNIAYYDLSGNQLFRAC